MSIYAVGDIHGCFAQLKELLESVRFHPQRDELWCVGDLVNRGLHCADVLRFLIERDNAVTAVLGNHDLHLLARAAGVTEAKKRDTLEEVLSAPDRDDLLDWVRRRPLLFERDGWLMVHAGLVPQWTVEQALALGREVEDALAHDPHTILAGYGDNACSRWDDNLTGSARWQTILNATTRMRVCSSDGEMALAFKGPLDQIPEETTPWFDIPSRRSTTHTVLFGHWAALGFYRRPNLIGLDSGCVWGRCLTAVRLDDGKLFSVSR